MSRFAMVTIFTVLAITAVGVFLEGASAWWSTGVVLLCYGILLGLGAAFMRLNYFCQAVCRGRAQGMCVALTFDDGPDPMATPLLLDLLKEEGVQAAFFIIGERASAHPEVVRRVHEEGHLIGNHTFRHRWWTNFLFGRKLDWEIQRTQDVLREPVGVNPVYFRSPMGLTNPHLGSALGRAGLTLVGWDVRGFDRYRTPEEVVSAVTKRVRDGSIIALHDGDMDPDKVVAAVSGLIRELRGRGFTLVRLDHLVNAIHTED